MTLVFSNSTEIRTAVVMTLFVLMETCKHAIGGETGHKLHEDISLVVDTDTALFRAANKCLEIIANPSSIDSIDVRKYAQEGPESLDDCFRAMDFIGLREEFK